MAWVLPLFLLLCFLAVLPPGNVPAGWFLLTHTDSPSVGFHHGQKPALVPLWCPSSFCLALEAQGMVDCCPRSVSSSRLVSALLLSFVLLWGLQAAGAGGRGGCGAALSGCGLGDGGGSPAEVAGEMLLNLGRTDFFSDGSNGVGKGEAWLS